ncbi:MAG: hypothetical protein EZS28_023960 [Streblomastix strix]|uniref:Uncharacterized protein n=1 Tax=Streblomastix strix TaxID=222440 RepID=A0A5J4VDE3_9EUKA|nr:MAG: hypothetical protein EZS28_023960 [Streblomastix strix]
MNIPQPNNLKFDPSLKMIADITPLILGIASPDSGQQFSTNHTSTSGGIGETQKSYYYEEDDIPQPNNLKFDPSLKMIADITPLVLGIASPDSGQQFSTNHTSTSGGSGEAATPKTLSLAIGTTPNISPKAQTKVQIIRNDHPRENPDDDINEYQIDDDQMNNGNINKPSPKLLTQMLPQVPYDDQQPPNQTDIPPHNTKSGTIPLPVPQSQDSENDNKPPEKQ